MAANKILILGPSGTGKSNAAKTLVPSETFIICPDEKELPFKGWKANYKTVLKDDGKVDMSKTNFYRTIDPKVIKQLLNYISDSRKDIKVVIIDTITHMMMGEFMRTAKEKSFDKWVDIALDTYNVLKATDNLRDDLTVIVAGHIEEAYDSEGILRRRALVPGGKLLTEKITLESMFTTVLYTDVTMNGDKPVYSFTTQNNGRNTCKSPEGMFPETKIPNDYKLVLEYIKKHELGE